MFENAEQLLVADALSDTEVEAQLQQVGFSDCQTARKRLLDVSRDERSRRALGQCLPMLLTALSDAADPDGSLINFERFAQSVESRAELFEFLLKNPRAVEILIRLFVGSQFLTEILLRHPEYLEELTRHKRLADFKSREEFLAEAHAAAEPQEAVSEKLDALRRYQRWELLRIGACDAFGLMDLKSITVQLSLLTDGLVQACLEILARHLDLTLDGFVVLAFGKLGGEELNYSSDIDLVFLSDREPARFWSLGQRLIKALMESTAEGFLYRVDMRLRPWGSSGALVNSVDAHLQYLQKHGRLWEKQALLKARPIAGDLRVGFEFLERVEPLIYSHELEEIRANVLEMKGKIEAELKRQGRNWGEVKSGAGSIRDIEFVVQFLQLAYGGRYREIRSFNTLDALVRLADFSLIQADEYRMLTSGYVFLRTVEHALQLMHHKQTHTLPIDRRELAYLARRLDYPGADEFLAYYERHRASIRNIYSKYLKQTEETGPAAAEMEGRRTQHWARMAPSYAKTFSKDEIQRHAKLLQQLSDDNLVEIDAQNLGNGLWQFTIVGFDIPGDFSMICGLLFVYGFDIVRGQAFTDEHVPVQVIRGRHIDRPDARRFINVFILRPPLEEVVPEVWHRYKSDLLELLQMGLSGQRHEAHGVLAKRVAMALRDVTEFSNTLYPVEITVDNDSSDKATVLNIRSDDTIGFLYELSNALALSGIDICRVIVASSGSLVIDTLHVTDVHGKKIVDPMRISELRAAVVLIKHFTHLLPRSPNPEAALLHFRDFLEQLFQRPNWVEEFSALERSEVLAALARVLGVSDFLWEDFLRLQHENLFPVLENVDELSAPASRKQLERELQEQLAKADSLDDSRRALNAFKDRAMFRVDLRHIMGYIEEFGQFSDELTDVAEVVVNAAGRLCDESLRARHGTPRRENGTECRLAICALGKCGGRELGYASDIELMFIYEDAGRTDGRQQPISNNEYFQKLVDCFTHTIEARREGIFQIDLRLRPYGRAGSPAVSLESFEQYFAPNGAAWPYERQALVKLRPIAGSSKFGQQVVALRDALVYTGEPFDVAAMRGMREKQVRQLVSSGTINAKLSPGGLVDLEYLVQGLQISFGHRNPRLRATNTLEALQALHAGGVLKDRDYDQAASAYVFLRRLIDALRMVRGHAKDLTVPDVSSEEFEFLARRLGYGADLNQLAHDLETETQNVVDLGRLLGNGNGSGSRSPA